MIEVNYDAVCVCGINSDCQACPGDDCADHEAGHSLAKGNWIWRAVRQRYLHGNLDDWFIERSRPERDAGVVYATDQARPHKAIFQQVRIDSSSLFTRLHDCFEIWILLQEVHG